MHKSRSWEEKAVSGFLTLWRMPLEGMMMNYLCPLSNQFTEYSNFDANLNTVAKLTQVINKLSVSIYLSMLTRKKNLVCGDFG